MTTLTILSIFNFTSRRKELTGYYTIIKKITIQNISEFSFKKKTLVNLMVVKYQFPTKQINERLKTQAPESGVIRICWKKCQKKNEVRKSKCCIL